MLIHSSIIVQCRVFVAFSSLLFLRSVRVRMKENRRASERASKREWIREIWKYSNYLLASDELISDALGRMWEFEQQESNHLIKSWTSLQFNSIYKIYCLESNEALTHKFIAVKKRSDTLPHISIVAFLWFRHFFICLFVGLLSRFFHRSTYTSKQYGVQIENGFFKCKDCWVFVVVFLIIVAWCWWLFIGFAFCVN